MKRLPRLFRTLLALSGWMLCFSAQAQIYTNVESWQTCTTSGATPTIQGNINVGRDAQVGDVIGPWIYLFPTNSRWNCTFMANNPAYPVFLLFNPTKGYASVPAGGGVVGVWGSIVHATRTYTVFQVNHNGQQIGFIVRFQIWKSAPDISNSSSALPVSVSLGQEQSYSVASSPFIETSGTPVSYFPNAQVRMVKIANNFPTANSSVNFRAARIGIRTDHRAGMNLDFATPFPHITQLGSIYLDNHPPLEIWAQVNILTLNNTCETSPVSVDLGIQHDYALPTPSAPLSSGPSQPFSFILQNCPAHMASITYTATPVPANAVINDGVLPLISPSTATGVGVQVFSSLAGNPPLPFGLTLNPTPTMGTPTSILGKTPFTEPLKFVARMVRTASVVTPGTVHAAMKMVMTYK